jgi:hypothetical protein
LIGLPPDVAVFPAEAEVLVELLHALRVSAATAATVPMEYRNRPLLCMWAFLS